MSFSMLFFTIWFYFKQQVFTYLHLSILGSIFSLGLGCFELFHVLKFISLEFCLVPHCQWWRWICFPVPLISLISGIFSLQDSCLSDVVAFSCTLRSLSLSLRWTSNLYICSMTKRKHAVMSIFFLYMDVYLFVKSAFTVHQEAS